MEKQRLEFRASPDTSKLTLGGDEGLEGEESNQKDSFAITAGLIFVAATVFRFYELSLKPLHHDEGVNGFFLRRLIEEGVYHYDPSNYHGPTLYYLSLIFSWFLGLDTFAVRAVPALCGLLVIVTLIPFRRTLGALSTLTAMALLAFSPGMVFQSRYFIHEILLVLFTMTLVLCVWKYQRMGTGASILGASASAALMFATKETAFISWGVLLLSALSSFVYLRVRGRSVTHEGKGIRSGSRLIVLLFAGLLLFVAINIVLYSSFFTYAEGVRGAVRTFAIWARTGEQHHVHPWWTYLSWLTKIELSLLVMGCFGGVHALWKGHAGLPLFSAFWAGGIIAAYSLIPYKTPWLMLNFLPPLAILGGYLVGQIISWKRGRMLAPLLLAVTLIWSCYQSILLNFYRYDDETLPYVYAPTSREFLQMLARVEEMAARIGSRENTPISVVYPDYWPMPWYLRPYSHVSFHGQMVATSDPIVIGSEAQEPLLKQRLGDSYARAGSWKQRNGLTPVVYVRREVAPIMGVR